MTYQTIGNTNVEWQDHEPLIWTMREEFGEVLDTQTRTYRFNWIDLREIVSEPLLLLLKEELIQRRHTIALVSVHTESNGWKRLFMTMLEHQCYEKKVEQIDRQFLAALQSISKFAPRAYLDTLRTLYTRNPESRIFSKDLQLRDFPSGAQKGTRGKRIDAILSSALTRSACVEVLARCHEAYCEGTMDIGLYSFANLAFTVYVRSESYRLIQLGDLKHDPTTDKFGIWIYPVKQRVALPKKIYYDLPSTVGMLLLKQRINVIEKFGHLVAESDYKKLALFPSTALNREKTAWRSTFSTKNFGQHQQSSGISKNFYAIKKTVDLSILLTSVALRHTIATQLALHGCSARTIQSVLKHANDKACRRYVDIAFHGLMKELSEAMEPAFETHFPVIRVFRSKDAPLKSADKALFSEDVKTGDTIFQGECGKDIRCEHAPFTCYGCSKFIPCFDSDHQVNLNIVNSEIASFSSAGQPYKVMVDRWTRVRYEIQMVISACNLYQAQIQQSQP